MFKNYLLVALRSIFRNKTFTFINIIGLTIGITVATVIYLVVYHDSSFDKFHKDGHRIFRVCSQFEFAGEKFYNSGVTMPLAPAVKGQIPGVEFAAPIFMLDGDTRVRVGNEQSVHRNQQNIIYADADYFKVFNYKWLAGSPLNALTSPNKVLLSEKSAALYFPNVDVKDLPGTIITFNDTIQCTVSGVVANFKHNTDFTFHTFISWPTLKIPDGLKKWYTATSASQLIVKLDAKHRAAEVEKKLQVINTKNAPPEAAASTVLPFLLQPLSEIHFDERFGTYFDNRLANKTTLYALLISAAFILLLGCINFINLSTANSVQRSKEIGIRKTIGGSKSQLVVQFLVETFVLTLFATLLSVALTPLLVKFLEDFVPQAATFDVLNRPELLVFLALLVIVVTVLAGFYPAWVLAAYKPISVLKGKMNSAASAKSGLSLRRVLTVSQFVIAQFFIMAVVIVSMQLNYTLTKDPGFKQDGIVYFQVDYRDTVMSKRTALADFVKKIPGVQMISMSNDPVASNGLWTTTLKYNDNGKENETSVHMKMGDTNYIKLCNLNLLAGRNLRHSDTLTELLINNTYAKILGFDDPQLAIGKMLEYDKRNVPIVGVLADFNSQSLHNPIKPLAIGSVTENYGTINMELANGANWNNIMEQVKAEYSRLYANADFEFYYQDETIRKYYDTERKSAFLLKCATGVTILISCLGLLGLSIYSITRRTKEIGIRKVLGATVLQIVRLMSTESIVLVLLAFIIAVPLAYYTISQWLNNFAYRVNISWWMFAITFAAQVFIAFLTVASQALRAARVNPAVTLKTE